MENDTLTIRTAFMVVIASILSALLIGWLIIGVGMVSSETPNKFYTFLSVIIGQGFMLVPLFWFLKSRNEIINQLREKGINSEIYLDQNKNLKKQLQYADRKNTDLAIIIGENEIKDNKILVKKLKSKKNNDQVSIKKENLVNEIKKFI